MEDMQAEKITKHLRVKQAIEGLEHVVSGLAYTINKIEHGDGNPIPKEDSTSKPKTPSFLNVLNDSPGALDSISQRIEELNSKLKEMLF